MASSPSSTSCSSPRSSRRMSSKIRATLTIADTASWYCSIIIVALILFTTFRDTYTYPIHLGTSPDDDNIKGTHLLDRPCDEIYVVGEGETLHTISDKCGDPFIVERNPHIHDPDDVFPGLVIRVLPVDLNNHRKLLKYVGSNFKVEGLIPED